MRYTRHLARTMVLLLAALLVECQAGPAISDHPRVGHDAAAYAAPSPYADISTGELRDVLAGLARAHTQKKQLSWWVAAPLVGKPVEPAFQPFYSTMGQKQDQLLAQLTAWAKARGIDLTFAYSNDNDGRALKIMEDRQEKLVRGDNQQQFEHDMLMQMFMDYESQISGVEALLPRVKDAELKAYLEASLRVHREGSAEILALLRRFRFAG